MSLLTIGEFSRATHLTVKALRHYDDVGLLRPAEVDEATGYRFYAAAQVPTARAIRRFRDLEMPLEDIRAILSADRPTESDAVILRHLEQMRTRLEQTQSTIASLHSLLDGRSSDIPVEERVSSSIPVLAIRERVAWDAAEDWLSEVFGELHRVAEEQGLSLVGPEGALYSEEFFETHEGELVAFLVVSGSARRAGRAEPIELPAQRHAVTVHEGPFADIDRAYAALGAYVTERRIGVAGPILERYLVTAAHTEDPAEHRTEVCWPVRG